MDPETLRHELLRELKELNESNENLLTKIGKMQKSIEVMQIKYDQNLQSIALVQNTLEDPEEIQIVAEHRVKNFKAKLDTKKSFKLEGAEKSFVPIYMSKLHPGEPYEVITYKKSGTTRFRLLKNKKEKKLVKLAKKEQKL
jgi:hypothetical protein